MNKSTEFYLLTRLYSRRNELTAALRTADELEMLYLAVELNDNIKAEEDLIAFVNGNKDRNRGQ